MDNDKFLNYLGYLGSVSYDEYSHELYGELVGIEDLVLFTGEDLDELHEDFCSGVEQYLEGCEADEKAPQQPFDGRFRVRISPETHLRLHELAQLRGISFSELLNGIFAEYIANRQLKHLEDCDDV